MEIGLKPWSHSAVVIIKKTDLEALSNFINKPLEGRLSDKELGGLDTRTELLGLLDSSSEGGSIGEKERKKLSLVANGKTTRSKRT